MQPERASLRGLLRTLSLLPHLRSPLFPEFLPFAVRRRHRDGLRAVRVLLCDFSPEAALFPLLVSQPDAPCKSVNLSFFASVSVSTASLRATHACACVLPRPRWCSSQAGLHHGGPWT